MIERLQHALQRIEEISSDQQDEIAAIIEDSLSPYIRLTSYAGVIAGMLPDDAEDELLRLRRESPPSPPIEEQLKGLGGDDDL